MTKAPSTTSLNALNVFETAARLGSFTRAAEELGISQPAVSHAIRGVEIDLGIVLFNRRNKGVFLTKAGKYLAEQVVAGLAQIQKGMDDVRSMNEEHQVTIAVSTATATWWLLPRISRFKQLHPKIELRCVTTDRDLDLKREGIDLAVTLGTLGPEDYQCWHFADEEVFPVCSPKFLQKNPMHGVRSLARIPLLTLEQRYRPRVDWKQWFSSFGASMEKDQQMLHFNDYSIVLQAAIEGQGVALGWKHIVEPLVQQGLLVRPVEGSLTTQNPFYIIAPKDSDLRSDVMYLKNWLIAEMA